MKATVTNISARLHIAPSGQLIPPADVTEFDASEADVLHIDKFVDAGELEVVYEDTTKKAKK